MLHEVLLALSGHQSPLFDQKAAGAAEDFPLLSASERGLLDSISKLSVLHRRLRERLAQIAASHHSTICRSVANSLRQAHLARFQKKILDVEASILTKDASLVGAYDIVPLASVVGEFDGWHRRMAWYWDLTCYMRDDRKVECSGAGLIDKLRTESQTGFPDVEEVAVELGRVAETGWLRQLSPWILHGNLPTIGADDFFVNPEGDHGEQGETFRKDSNLLPKFLGSNTAASILFIGKSLNQVRHYHEQISSKADTASELRRLAVVHMKHLSTLALPIVPAQLSRAVAAIRQSLSRNVLQHLHPLENTLIMLGSLRKYFLLDDGEFAIALITEAEARLEARWQSMGRLLQQDPVKAMQGLLIKDAELSQTLSRTWRTLASRHDSDDDGVFDFARTHVTLAAPRRATARPSSSDGAAAISPPLSSVVFHDMLFPNASALGMTITPPLDLVISSRDIETYSAINAYLVAIRRSHSRLSDLWKKTPARRNYPEPPGPRYSSSEAGRAKIAMGRERVKQRTAATRKIWASCSAAIFLLAETAAYLEGEIITSSWDRLMQWVKVPVIGDAQETGTATVESVHGSKEAHHDPETLAAGHRAFLASLTYALLLTDVPYTKDLRSLLGNIDQLVAQFDRLLSVQQKLDLEHDAGHEGGLVEDEERKVALDLDRARKKVDSDLKSVINRLSQLDQERIGAGRYLDLSGAETGGFEPWKGGGVDRLLMKLEFGRMREEGFDIV